MKHLPIILTLIGVVSLPGLYRGASADTTFLLELAKNKPRVLIITSGPQAAELGQQLQAAILHANKNKHNPEDAPVLSLDQAENAIRQASEPKAHGASTIFLFVTKELTGMLSPSITSLMPFHIDSVARNATVLKSEISRPAKAGLAFSVAIAAPDKARLSKMLDAFMTRHVYDYKALPFAEEHITNKVAVFSSPEDREAVEKWGTLASRSAWNDVNWYALDDRQKLTNEQLADGSEVYFINRSHGTMAPEPAANLVSQDSIKEMTTLIHRSDRDDGSSAVVFTAPNDKVLRAKAVRYPNVAAVPKGTTSEEVLDLRHLGTTTAVVWGVGTTPDQREQIRATLAGDMRTSLRVPVEERGEILRLLEREVATQELLGGTDTAKMLRSQKAVRYIWVYRIAGYNGSTGYKQAENCLTTERPETYEVAHGSDDPEPMLNLDSRGGGRADEERRKRPAYEAAHSAWEQRKAYYNDNMVSSFPMQWERTVTRSSTAQVSGTLQLIDLKNSDAAGKVIWEHDCRGAAFSPPTTYKSDRVTVRGVSTRPSSLDAPPSEDTCPPNLLLEAAREAGTDGLKKLEEQAWVSNDPVPATDNLASAGNTSLPTRRNVNSAPGNVAAPQSGTATVNSAYAGAKVALVDHGTVILKIEPQSGMMVGDKVEIGLQMRDIPDPDNPSKLLRQDVVRKATLRITRIVDNTAYCIPANTLEAAKLGQITPKMPVVYSFHPTPAKSQSAGPNIRRKTGVR